MEKTKVIKIFLGLTYLVIISLLLWVFFNNFTLSEVANYAFIKNKSEYLIEIKNQNIIVSIFLFLFFIVLWVFLLGFGTPVFLFGGYIFGKWLGTILVTFGLSIGATLFYIFANYFFKDLVKEKLEKKIIKLNLNLEKNEFIFMLIYRFVGGIPFAISNLLPILFNIKLRNFFLASFLGMMPQLFVGSSLGSGIEKIINENSETPTFFQILSSPDIYIPILGFIFLIIVGLFLKKFIIKKN